MHFLNAVIALVCSLLYLFFSLPAVYPTIAVVEVALTLLKTSGWTYMLLALAHAVALIQMVRRSLRFRGLTFTSRHKQSMPTKFTKRLRGLERAFWRPWNHLFGVEGVFGVNGRYFHVAFLAREAVEVGLQTYQAYQLSGAVRRAWITNLAVATIVLNSVSTPLVYIILHHHQESARRFVSILVDMSVDFLCAAVIPLCVVYPYIAMYDTSIGSFPLAFVNDDVLFTSSLIEIRQFCVTSILDFVATAMPHVTVFTCLNLAKKIVQRDTRPCTSCADGKPVKSKRISMAIVVSLEGSTVDSSRVSALVSSVITRSVSAQRGHIAFHVCMVAWSAIILSVHVRASSYANASVLQGCRLSLNQWYAVGTPCSVMQINCHRRGIQGFADEIASILRPLDRVVLRKLIITHCTSLEIPTRLGEFSEMSDLTLYNSTLAAWPLEAAATPETMTSLVNFNWFCSPYINFPAGLLHNNLPKSFSRFSIVRSNATELPFDLGTLWARRNFDLFSVQFTQIDQLPPSFSELTVRKLRLISNRIRTINDRALATKRFTSLHLSGNPLESWPASIGDTSGLLDLLVEYTNIRTLPADVEQWWNKRPNGLFSKRSFSLYGSPVCNGMRDAPFCFSDRGNRNGTYRWDLIEPQRELDT